MPPSAVDPCPRLNDPHSPARWPPRQKRKGGIAATFSSACAAADMIKNLSRATCAAANSLVRSHTSEPLVQRKLNVHGSNPTSVCRRGLFASTSSGLSRPAAPSTSTVLHVRIFLICYRKSLTRAVRVFSDIPKRAGADGLYLGEDVFWWTAPAIVQKGRHLCRPFSRLCGGTSVTREKRGPAIWEVGRETTASARSFASTL